MDGERLRIVNNEGLDCTFNYKYGTIETFFKIQSF